MRSHWEFCGFQTASEDPRAPNAVILAQPNKAFRPIFKYPRQSLVYLSFDVFAADAVEAVPGWFPTLLAFGSAPPPCWPVPPAGAAGKGAALAAGV